MSEKLLIVICIIGLLLFSPISAKEVVAKVDDKKLLIDDNRDMFIGVLHTCYGEITVNNEDYNSIMVNDTIRYNTDMINYFWTPFWDVEKVN